ncbi:MAG: hypothetical protein LBK82_00005, partial [Planctomycetaceae bacterium]|jgi:hypothetical protein|nr:hypothetical protein [Planctomycetaceae bacterium]
LPLLTVGNLIPKRKATQFAVVNLIHCRRVRRRDLLAKGRPPDDCLLLTKILLEYCGNFQ